MTTLLRSDQVVDGISIENLRSSDDSDDENAGTGGGGGGDGSLPGAASGGRVGGSAGGPSDGSRNTRPAMIASALKFSISGREWAVATTQGLQVRSRQNDFSSLVLLPFSLYQFVAYFFLPLIFLTNSMSWL